MSDFKFRVLDDSEEISSDERNKEEIVEEVVAPEEVIEDEVIVDDNVITQEEVLVDEVIENVDIDDARVLSYLKDRYQKEFDSLDDVLINDNKYALPEDIKQLMEFGVDNYVKINKDWDSESDINVLKEYYKQTKPHLDNDDVDYLLSESYSFDEEYDDEKDIRKKKVALKEELFKAKEYLNNLKEQYKVDLGSKKTEVPDDYKEAFEFYKKYTENSQKESSVTQKKVDVFLEKTDSLFDNDFKGFEFDLGDKKQVYKPNDVLGTKKAQLDIESVLSSHVDKNGFLKDGHQYHKALAMFRDPDGFAKFFYEQGKSDATDNVIKDVKNIDMSVRDIKEVTPDPNKPRMRAVSSDDFEGGMKIRKRK